MMKEPLPMTLARCRCCDAPATLLPRRDLPGAIAVCPSSGQPYRLEGETFVPTSLPDLSTEAAPPPSVRIDLSRSGYA